MNCGCNSSGLIDSWIDWRDVMPTNPLDLIAHATLNGVVGTYALSTNYAPTGGAWQPNAWSINGPIVCQALETDNLQNAGTRGDQQGAIPVIQWSGAFPSGPATLELTLQNVGRIRAMMGFKALDTGSGQPTMYESEWMIVP